MPDYPMKGTISQDIVGTVTIDAPAPTPPSGGGQSNYQWSWSMVLRDPPHYTRTQTGKGKGINIPTGNYPPGYKVANGQPGGGWPTGQSNGTLPIKLIPPTSGNGRCHFITHFKFLVVNKESAVRKFCIGLGVSDVVSDPGGGGRPMYPYLGCAHDLGVWEGQMSFETIQPGESRLCTGFRLDMVDNAFSQDLPIPDWPNWTLNVNAGNKLWPGVTPLMTVETGSLEVQDAFLIGYAF
jgi:hypothetical protein